MIIKGLRYIRHRNSPREWSIVGKDDQHNEAYVYFDNINLLIGKNASGKSRTLEAILDLSDFIAERQTVGKARYETQCFDFLFTDNEDKIRYVLDFKNGIIENESLYRNDEEILNRRENYIVLLREREKLPTNLGISKLAVNLVRDNRDYYFPKLVNWAITLKEFMFTDQAEKNRLIEDINTIQKGSYDTKSFGTIIPIFHLGVQDFGQRFEKEILKCMNELGYKITNIDINKTRKGYCINVEEEGKYMVPQYEMSHGMFRTLGLLIMMVNASMRELSVCILIDDIGEGLDHERSKSAIDILVRLAYGSEIQYFISTNDRYVMNYINLKYWSIIERLKSKAIIYNIYNSKENFESFKYTGLNNFDFFTTDFYKDGFGDDNSEDENKELS